MSVVFIDNSEFTLEAFDEACIRALERCGMKAEDYAFDLVPKNTSTLGLSITHRVDEGEPAVYIGTNVEYAGYVEFGTGHHSSVGGGTPKSHWVYMGDDGKFHIGKPQPPRPYLKPAVANHTGTYRNIIKDELSNG